MIYQVFLLRDQHRPGATELVNQCRGELSERVRAAGGEVFGTFLGLFGLAGNACYLVVNHPAGITLDTPPEVEIATTWRLRPTVRPTAHTPRERPGLYVFRWFRVAPENVDEIVHLSAAAWPQFEGSFETEIQGLFAEDADSPGQMLLITWYRDLSVWEASRHPPDAARDNFLRRHRLTLGATPVATQLALPSSEPGLVTHS